MLASIVLGLDAIRRRDFVAHGAWMTHAYAIGMGAGTQVLTHLPWFILAGKPGESARTVLMGAGWVINVIVAEWIIRRRGVTRAPSTRGAMGSASAPRHASATTCHAETDGHCETDGKGETDGSGETDGRGETDGGGEGEGRARLMGGTRSTQRREMSNSC